MQPPHLYNYWTDDFEVGFGYHGRSTLAVAARKKEQRLGLHGRVLAIHCLNALILQISYCGLWKKNKRRERVSYEVRPLLKFGCYVQ